MGRTDGRSVWDLRCRRAAAVRPAALICLLAAVAGVGASQEEPQENRLLSNVRQLTFEGRRAGEGYFSKDGRYLVFQSERAPQNPFFQIYLMDLETGDVERISPGHGKTTCAWVFPDNDRILFASTHHDPQARNKQREEIERRERGEQRRYAWDYDENFDLYIYRRSTGAYTRLTDARGYDAEGAVSPDGSKIVFSSNRHAYTGELSKADAEKFEADKSFLLDLYLMNADGSGLRRLTTARGYDGGPFFSFDGKQICWRRFSEDGATAEIYTMDADGGGETQITHLGAMSWAPFFHPSGEYLIFTTNLHGFANFELYIVPAGGGEPVRVTCTEGFDGLPVFSPDGKTLAWTSNRGLATKQGQLFMADWNHTEALRLLREARESKAGDSDAAAQVENPVRAIARKTRTLPQIRPEDVRLYVERLASDEFEGRLTGTEGERKATQYVADVLRDLGLEPAGDNGSYFQEFEFTAGVALGEDNALTLSDESDAQVRSFEVDADWRPLAFSATEPVEPTEVVFAGYGIVAPAEGDFEEYDSFVHLDLNGKWVMVLRYLPEDVAPERRQHLNPYSGLRYKAMVIRDRGARGMIVVSGPNSGVKEQLVKMRFDASGAAGSLAAISMTDAAADAILQYADKSLQHLQDALDGGEPQMGFAVPGVQLAARIDIERVKRTGRNVLARLAAGPNEGDEPVLVVGAHVDHLGRGEGTNSLAREDEQGEIHYGADDNASGVAGMLEIAQYLADLERRGELELKRDVVFAAWSGEELGLLGSNHFVKQIGEAIDNESDIHEKVAAYLNLDMIGRLGDALTVQGVGSSSLWQREIERRNAPIGLNVVAKDDSYLPTDATAFYLKGVPILSVFTGAHEDYHSPRDTADKIDYESAAKIARFVGLVARSLATRTETPDFQQVESPEQRGQRARLRAYLGTIPDYSSADVTGVKLSGVSKDGPADQAGLQGGDVIVEVAGRKIENIYDYTYAIEALKIGEPVEIVVLRDNEQITLTVTPGSRE